MKGDRAYGIMKPVAQPRIRSKPVTTLTIEIPDEQMELLERRAASLGLTPQELVQASIEELLAQADQDLQAAITHILQKNAELYRRLA